MVDQTHVAALGPFVRDIILAKSCGDVAELPSPLLESNDPVYAAFRSRGSKVFDTWAVEASQIASITLALTQFARSANDAIRSEVDTVELCLTSAFRDIEFRSVESERLLVANALRGTIGIELSLNRESPVCERTAPTTMIATNRSFKKLVNDFCRHHDVTDAEQADGTLGIRTFKATQILVRISDEDQASSPSTTQLFRGNQVVQPAAITKQAVAQLEQLLGDYLIRSVQSDGRIRYLYYPSRGKEDLSRNNQIRQWMATLALGQVAKFRNDDSIYELAERNIRYNLDHFFERRGSLGIIDDHGKVKLGAVALAVSAIMSHPNRDLFRVEEKALWNTIDFLWQDSGEFKTFLVPKLRNDLHNFYPGEALLAWSMRYAETQNDQLLSRFMKSFEYYRSWHRENRNPAFIPWHTQAYFAIWRHTQNQDLQHFIFEMNDWVLEIQQWDDAPALDCRGRFYDPKRPFGPPHASSTGVYLEGLCDAFELASKVGDETRAAAYHQAILRGLRSVSQLTFKDDIDMFYVHQRNAVCGGVRTTVYDNVIRIDNVQHNLMAILKWLSLTEPSVSC